MSEPERKQGFFLELMRRRVIRSAGAYVVVAWVAIQVADVVLPQFAAPAWALRALIIVFLAGFPPAMLLAWTIDVSREGIEVTPESGYSRAKGAWPKLVMVLAATAVSCTALWWMWDDYIVQPDLRPTRSEIKTLPVVAVNPPRKVTGGEDIDWLGEGVANLVRSELAESQYIVVVSDTRWKAMSAEAADPDAIVELAATIGVDYLVDGVYVETPNGIVLTTRIEDVEERIDISSSRTEGDDPADLIGKMPALGVRIKQALRVPYEESVGVFEADFASANIDAYEAYVAGLALLNDFEYQAAEDALKAALEIAPDYHIARFRLAQVYEYSGRAEQAAETLALIPENAELPERVRLYVAGARAYFAAARDMKKAIHIYQELVKAYPYEMEAGHYLAEAYWLDFQDEESIREFRRVRDAHPYDPVAWMALGERLLDFGELDEAKEVLSKYAEMRPDDEFAFALLGNLAMLQGELDAAVEQHLNAISIRPGFVVATIGLARARYLRGEYDQAVGLWQSVVEDAEQAAIFRIDSVFELAGVLRGLGRFEESLQPFAQADALIRAEGLRLPMALSEQGSTWLELGDADRAAALIGEAVETAPPPGTRYLFARAMLELRLGNLDDLADTVADIRGAEGGDDEAAQIAARAADYLSGLAALEQRDYDGAEPLLRSAVQAPRFQYAPYKAGLAALRRATGDLQGAASMAAQAATEREAGDLRLDLELDRARAMLLHAEILAEQGLLDESRELSREFLARWAHAAADRPELIRAARLASGE